MLLKAKTAGSTFFWLQYYYTRTPKGQTAAFVREFRTKLGVNGVFRAKSAGGGLSYLVEEKLLELGKFFLVFRVLGVEGVEVEAVDVLRLGISGFVAEIFAGLAISLKLAIVLGFVLG